MLSATTDELHCRLLPTTYYLLPTMIDTHIHVVPPNLPGAGALGAILNEPPDAIADRLQHEMREAGVGTALAMGCLDAGPGDPLGIATTLEIGRRVPGVYAIGAADPRRR